MRKIRRVAGKEVNWRLVRENKSLMAFAQENIENPTQEKLLKEVSAEQR